MVKVGLFARLQAKPGKETEVAKLLEGALALAREERETTVWYALRFGPRPSASSTRSRRRAAARRTSTAASPRR